MRQSECQKSLMDNGVGTFVNSEALGFTNLSEELPNGLLRTAQSTQADFLICGTDQRFAVCLEAESGFMAFELDAINDAWRGCFVTGVQLQADISSAFTTAERDVRPGDLVFTDA